VVEILGTKGIFNIRSIVISSLSDTSGFYIDELHYDQFGDVTDTPEPAALALIAGGLLAFGIGARRRLSIRK
jgi:hypothetical protein